MVVAEKKEEKLCGKCAYLVPQDEPQCPRCGATQFHRLVDSRWIPDWFANIFMTVMIIVTFALFCAVVFRIVGWALEPIFGK